MFENIIGQDAVIQLRSDIQSSRNAPSMLFFGPSETGKGSAALELARVMSCEENAVWKCPCSSCERHRYLLHDDLLVLGTSPRLFSAEIAAAGAAFLRNHAVLSAKILFFRSLRKLQIRFSPVLAEDDPKIAKNKSALLSLDEKLNDLWALNIETCEKSYIENLSSLLIEEALVLEKDALSSNIPINHIRSASSWCRLAPNGKRKTLIIENADKMNEQARNALLKLLEEPPSGVSIALTTQRREAIIPTILSRLRSYRFLKRDAADEKEVIRLVFKDAVNEAITETKGSLLSAYLESFAHGNAEKMRPLAAWFIVSLARIIAVSAKRNGIIIPRVITMLSERYAPIAKTISAERVFKSGAVIKTIMAQNNNFENDSFSRFMKICLEMICAVTRSADNPEFIAYNDIFKKCIGDAVTAVEVINIKETAALEALIYNLKKAALVTSPKDNVPCAVRGQ